ncbi:MAG: hypothetical protein KatS3mg105_4735 [Gemmatales bacterium]|nr:MAG: hypothetical protein KatS3mg105_4735 [Gemmatales bacterium]
MQIDVYGLGFLTSRVTFYLWSPWRASALEHRLFEAVGKLPKTKQEKNPDECRLHIEDAETFRSALLATSRVLMGWQEEADHTERRTWCWLIEGDVDHNGYEHTGDPASLWAIVRVSIERGGPGETDKGEDVDLEGFGFRIWPISRP